MSESTTQPLWLKRHPTDTSLSGTSRTLFVDAIHAQVHSYSDDDPSLCHVPCESEPTTVDTDFTVEVPVEAMALSDELQGEVRVDTSPAVKSRHWYCDDLAYIDFDSHDDAVRAFDDSPWADIELSGGWKSSGEYDTLPDSLDRYSLDRYSLDRYSLDRYSLFRKRSPTRLKSSS
jgi:hypothetical protein